MDQPIESANCRTVTMRIPACPSRTSKSLSPVTIHVQPPAAASARISSSSGSRQTAGIEAGADTNCERCRAKRVSRAACRGVALNLSGSFCSISAEIQSPEHTSCSLRRRRHNRRQVPGRVSTASQTLVSRSTFTPRPQARKREEFLFGHRVIDRQRIRPCEKRLILL